MGGASGLNTVRGQARQQDKGQLRYNWLTERSIRSTVAAEWGVSRSRNRTRRRFDPMKQEVTTYYLEILDPEEFTPSEKELPDLEIREAEIACAGLGRFLYTTVGRDWGWTDRLNWPRAKWLAHLERREVEMWIAHLHVAGYVELESQPEKSVEIVCFGLLPQFLGQGIGSVFLSDTVERTFRGGARRIWLHTCSLDSPRAMENYGARGFKLFDEKTTLEDVPSLPSDQDAWKA